MIDIQKTLSIEFAKSLMTSLDAEMMKEYPAKYYKFRTPPKFIFRDNTELRILKKIRSASAKSKMICSSHLDVKWDKNKNKCMVIIDWDKTYGM